MNFIIENAYSINGRLVRILYITKSMVLFCAPNGHQIELKKIGNSSKDYRRLLKQEKGAKKLGVLYDTQYILGPDNHQIVKPAYIIDNKLSKIIERTENLILFSTPYGDCTEILSIDDDSEEYMKLLYIEKNSKISGFIYGRPYFETSRS